MTLKSAVATQQSKPARPTTHLCRVGREAITETKVARAAIPLVPETALGVTAALAAMAEVQAAVVQVLAVAMLLAVAVPTDNEQSKNRKWKTENASLSCKT